MAQQPQCCARENESRKAHECSAELDGLKHVRGGLRQCGASGDVEHILASFPRKLTGSLR